MNHHDKIIRCVVFASKLLSCSTTTFAATQSTFFATSFLALCAKWSQIRVPFVTCSCPNAIRTGTFLNDSIGPRQFCRQRLLITTTSFRKAMCRHWRYSELIIASEHWHLGFTRDGHSYWLGVRVRFERRLFPATLLPSAVGWRLQFAQVLLLGKSVFVRHSLSNVRTVAPGGQGDHPRARFHPLDGRCTCTWHLGL